MFVVGLYLWVPIFLGAMLSWPLFWLTGFRLTPSLVLQPVGYVALSACATVLVARLGRGRRVGAAITAFYQLAAAGGAAMLLAYAAAASGRPLVDGTLLGIDRALHYEWRAYAHFFAEHRGVARIVLSTYFTMLAQPLLLILVLSATRRYELLEKFILASFASLLLTVSIFALYPATTAWNHLGVPDPQVTAYRFLPLSGDGWVKDLLDIRGGGRPLPFGSPLIAFPSLHCASGLVYLWASWRVGWLRLLLVVLNAMMLAATPIMGGHYLADLLGGAAVALAAVMIAERSYPLLVKWADAMRARLGSGAALVPATA